MLKPIFDLDADILCLQETKASLDAIPELELMKYPYRYFHAAEKRGYSGTAILSKVKPIKVINDFTGKLKDKHPDEGRIQAAEFDEFYLVNVYVPNSKRGLLRLPYRDKEWDPDFRVFLNNLAKKKPVVVCGDFNVAHEEIDIANPQGNRKNAGFTDEERANFTKLLDSGFTDTFRYLHPEKKDAYSWWTFRFNARKRNVGWRIDYFLVSEKLKSKIKKAEIYPEIYGSDHAPVTLKIDI